MNVLARDPTDLNAGFEPVLRQVERLEEALLNFQAAERTREILLVRFCFGGMRLKQAVEVPVSVLLASDSEDDLEKSLPRYRRTDVYFPGLEPLCSVAKRHYVSLKARWKSGDMTDTGSKPAFPSRKKGVAVTSRTAERRLEHALSHDIQARRLTYRAISRLGVLARANKPAFCQLRDRQAAENNRLSIESNERWQLIFQEVHRFLQKRLDNPATVEDAVQETMIRMSGKWATSKKDLSLADDVRLAIGIAKNVLLEIRRYEKVEHITNLDNFFWEALTTNDLETGTSRSHQDSRYVATAIQELLGCLEERQRNVIKFIFSHEPKTCREVAESMGMVTRSVQRIKAQALKKLRKQIMRGSSAKMKSLIAHLQ